VKESAEKILKAGESIESFRRSVNEAYSQAPEDIKFNFPDALDQLADHQFALTGCWKNLLFDDDAVTAELAASRTVEEAQRVTLQAWRAFVETRQQDGEQIATEVRKLQTDVTDLIEEKDRIDQNFRKALESHERNLPVALDQLRQSEADYKQYISKATAKIAGTRVVHKRERMRQRLVYISTICATLALLIALLGRENIIRVFKELFTNVINKP